MSSHRHYVPRAFTSAAAQQQREVTLAELHVDLRALEVQRLVRALSEGPRTPWFVAERRLCCIPVRTVGPASAKASARQAACTILTRPGVTCFCWRCEMERAPFKEKGCE